MKLKLHLLLAGALLALIGCSKKEDDKDRIQPRPEVRASSVIGDSFTVTTVDQPQLGKDQTQVWIHKTALDKEFLLQSAQIPQVPVAAGSGLKSRVVAFRLKGSQLFMMEAVQGHSVTTELPQNLILARFPVLEEKDGKVLFDFNSGMNRVFTYGDWQSSADDGTEYPGNDVQLASFDVRLSYIEEALLLPKNFLMVRQVIQGVERVIVGLSLEEKKKSGNGGLAKNPVRESLVQQEIRYYLSPYQPDPTYTPIKSPGFDRVGYFEVAPLAKDKGGTSVWASRFHPGKPIVFAISANTPPEYRQAVADGILYWNRAFGREVIRVDDTIDPYFTAPNPDYNIVQWVNWDLAGFAYADAQMDPRSGEILHAQVYMTSAFAFLGKARMRQLARHLEEAERTSHRGRVGLQGFEKATLCRRNFNESLLNLIGTLEAENASDEKILKASQDYVREVVAHEIGHTLGLRHNFAGNLAANYPTSSRPQILKDYLTDAGSIFQLVTSSSVMEYQVFLESIVTGHQIASGRGILPYDRAVVGTLYLDEKIDRVRIPFYCTDHHADLGGFSDCHRFDYGSSFVEYSSAWWNEVLGGLAKETLEKYIRAQSPVEGEEVVPVDEVNLKPAAVVVADALEGQVQFIKSLTQSGKVLRVHRQFSQVGEVNQPKVTLAQEKYIQGEIARMGGYPQVLPSLGADWSKAMTTQFIELLEKHRSGAGYSGAYEFTQEEIDYMLAHVSAYFENIQKLVRRGQLKMMNMEDDGGVLKDQKLRDSVLTQEHMKHLLEQAKAMILQTTGQVFETEVSFVDEETKKPRKETIRIPLYSLPMEDRELAVKALNSDKGAAIDHGVTETAELKETWEGFKETHAPEWLMKISLETVPQTLRRWIMETKKIDQLLADE